MRSITATQLTSDLSLGGNGEHSGWAQSPLLQAARDLKRAQGTFLLPAHGLLGCLAGSAPDLCAGGVDAVSSHPRGVGGGSCRAHVPPSILQGTMLGGTLSKEFWEAMAELNPHCSQHNPENTPLCWPFFLPWVTRPLPSLLLPGVTSQI